MEALIAANRVKPLPLPDMAEDAEPDLFHGLVPVEVTSAAGEAGMGDDYDALVRARDERRRRD